MSTAAATLVSIERRVHRAIVQELRLMRLELQALRATLAGDERDHANALLLQLEHLEAQQMVPSVPPGTAPVYLAPDLRIGAAMPSTHRSMHAEVAANRGTGPERTLAGV